MLTSFRKKIKCSGERNCLTCREKGLVCEGLPERKRPKRNSLDSSILDPKPAGVDHIRRLSATTKGSSSSPKQRPGSLLRLSDVAKSNDSGYGTSPSPAATNASSNKSSIETPSPSNVEDRSRRISPAPFRVDIWDVSTGESTPKASQSALEEQQHPVKLSPIPPSPTSSKPPPLTKRNSSQDEISWWNKPHHLVTPHTTDLSTAAQIVFGESVRPGNSLPRNGDDSKKPVMDLDGMPVGKPPPLFSDFEQSRGGQRDSTPAASTANRRQTVQFPVAPAGSASSTTAGVGLGLSLSSRSPPPPMHQHHNFHAPIPQEPGIFDDMAALLSSTISAFPANPNTSTLPNVDGSLSPWWGEINDITSMLSQAGAVLKDDEDSHGKPLRAGFPTIPEEQSGDRGEGRIRRGDEGLAAGIRASGGLSASRTAAPATTNSSAPTPTTTTATATSSSTPATSNLKESPPNARTVKRRPVVGDFYW